MDENIDPTALLRGLLQLEGRITIGPFSVIGRLASPQPVLIGEGTIIGSYCTIDEGVTIGRGVTIEDYVSIARGTRIDDGARLLYRAQLHLDVRVGERSIVGGFLCDRSVVGSNSRVFGHLIHASKPPFAAWDSSEEPSPAVGDDAFVGLGALIIGDTRINDGAYIAAGAIASRDVPARHCARGVNRHEPNPW